jgi:hypothetical protein
MRGLLAREAKAFGQPVTLNEPAMIRISSNVAEYVT